MTLSKEDLEQVSAVVEKTMEKRLSTHDRAVEQLLRDRDEAVSSQLRKLGEQLAQLGDRVTQIEQHSQTGGRIHDTRRRARQVYHNYQELSAEEFGGDSVFRPRRQLTGQTGGSIIEPMQNWRRKPGY
jgi:small-conductance mechanosensitive channel